MLPLKGEVVEIAFTQQLICTCSMKCELCEVPLITSMIAGKKKEMLRAFEVGCV